MQNTAGRLARAYTCDSSCNWVTDVAYSYDARGELQDVYQWSTGAGSTYYHMNATYWPHGQLQTLSGLVGLPALTYGSYVPQNPSIIQLDGEGRVTGMGPQGSANLATITYNNSDPGSSNEPLGAILTVGLGSADSDVFTYDPHTGRMATYQFNVNGVADLGQLTWNNNGSLQNLQVTDHLVGSADSQNCGYTHDDLGRLNAVACGSIWWQIFTYDAFGNITKNLNPLGGSAGAAFTPNYNTATNHFSFSTGPKITYDNDGNLTYDTIHNYTWAADGTLQCVDGNILLHDALGRAVEVDASTNCSTVTGTKEMVYGPDGSKLALMSGQSLSKAFVSLPGGATAVYNSSGLAYYRHSDWLGSSRLSSSLSRTWLYDGAYAPFGESYAEATNSGGSIDHSFTGQNEDTASGLDDFLFREYSASQQGRWISPDPAGLAVVDPANPQSWNRYAYVLNNPLVLFDPLGLMTNCTPSQPQYCNFDSDPPPGPNDAVGQGPCTPIAGTFGTVCLVLSQGGNARDHEGGGGGRPNCLPPGVAGPLTAACARPPSTGCSVSASCDATPITHGFGHCSVTVNQNGKYTTYDGGPNPPGDVWNSTLFVRHSAGGPPGAKTFYINDSCTMAGCVPQVEQQINNANMWYSFPFQNSNTAAGMMLNECGANVSLPVWGPQ